jgi:hypothetical protein
MNGREHCSWCWTDVRTFEVELILHKQFTAEDSAALEEVIKAWFARRKERDPKLNLQAWRILSK